MQRTSSCLLLLGLGLLFACEANNTPAPDAAPPLDAKMARLSLEQLKDPETCKTCHERQYDEWARSMHAYASEDPVFRAMNKRGQRETNGELGSFCVQCHAPMAFREELTEDGLNVDELPKWAQGVTCYFCHNADGVGEDAFNADLTLAHDDVMRGGFAGSDPGPHGIAKSEFHDRDSAKSSRLCGTCHDVVLDNKLHIERTFKEYEESVSSLERFSVAEGGESCQGCHMRWTATDYVAGNGSLAPRKRDLHDHSFPAVDVALTDFPGREEHLQATRCELTNSIYVNRISVDEIGNVSVAFETLAGHAQPSGAAQDRRMWLEFIAYDEAGEVLFESGTIQDGEVELRPNDERPNRQQLCMFRDYLVDDAGKEAHMFWEATKLESSRLLPPQTVPAASHEATCRYRIPRNQRPARVEMKLKMRPMGVDILQSLVESGDLDPKIIDEMPTFTLHGTHVQWKAEDGDTVEMPTQLSQAPGCD